MYSELLILDHSAVIVVFTVIISIVDHVILIANIRLNARINQ